MKKTAIIFSLLLIIMLVSCSPSNSSEIITEELATTQGEYAKITGEEAKEMMDTQEVIIVDVRELSEYNAGHIENAILLPVGSIEADAATTLPDQSATLLIYCRSGNRSQTASNILLDLGYQNVYDFGGIIDWQYDIIVEE